MKILNGCSFIKPTGIAMIEEEYNAKYVFETCLRARGGGWANFDDYNIVTFKVVDDHLEIEK